MHEDKVFPGIQEVLDYIQKEGYKWEFKVKDGQLQLRRFDQTYDPNNVGLAAFYRFHDEVENNDIPFIYALETHDNIQGYLIDFRDQHSDAVQKVVQQLKPIKSNQERDNKDIT